MAELIWLFIVLLFGFACGYAARSSISRRRRDAERKRFRSHQMKEGGLSRPEIVNSRCGQASLSKIQGAVITITKLALKRLQY